MKTHRRPKQETRVSRAFLAGIFLVSSSTLMLEIAVTRLFSAMLDYHYTFAVVSLALLGIGLGSIYAGRDRNQISAQNRLAKLAFLLATSIPLSVAAITLMPYPNLSVYLILMLIPFFFSGMLLSTAYKILGTRSQTIYFSDLAGAAAGSAAIVPLLDLFGAVNVVPLIGAVAAAGSILFSPSFKRWRLILIFLVTLSTFFLAPQLSGQRFLLGSDPSKELYSTLKDTSSSPRLVESRWNSFSRTDLVEFDAYPHVKAIFTDGSAGTLMYHFNGDFDATPDLVELRDSTTYFPFRFGVKENVLIIGPGGGVDVVAALMGESKRVTAVEINRQTVDIVRDYSSYSGGIYSDYSNVAVFVDEGRSFLKRSVDRYDVIMLNIPITKTMEDIGGYALSENYLFTTESFRDYLNHLTEDGRLVIVAHERGEVYRLATIALKVFEEQGKSVQEALTQISVVETPSAHGGHQSFPVFILKKTPFKTGEVKAMYAAAAELRLVTTYFPGMSSADDVLPALAKGSITAEELIKGANADLAPVTDDTPFFYKFVKGLPESLSLLLFSVLLLAVMLIALERAHRSRKGGVNSTSLAFYFSLLGAGFMLIEVALIQRLSLFLGYPTLSLSVLLTSLLASSGIGSLISQRFRPATILKAPLLISGLVAVYVLALPVVLNAFFSLPLHSRVPISVALIFPLGLVMGIPFPAGVRMLKAGAEDRIPWMWGLNSVFSLLGSVLAVAVAMASGFSYALLIGAVTYFTVFLIGYRTLKPLSVNLKNC